jgi:hypothetical protein
MPDCRRTPKLTRGGPLVRQATSKSHHPVAVGCSDWFAESGDDPLRSFVDHAPPIRKPRFCATCRGVTPRLSGESGFAPWASSNSIMPGWRQFSARRSGVSPLMSRASISAPAESSTEPTAKLSRRAAVCSGVPRIGPLWTFTAAPWRISVSATAFPSAGRGLSKLSSRAA